TFAHEIRNPLSSIKMMMQLASEQTVEEKTARFIDNTLEEIDRLNEIVEEMLDFSRPSALQLVPCDLGALIDGVIELMTPNLSRQGVEVRFHPEERATVPADGDGLKRVLLNLLLNASQAQPDGGKIDVTLSAGANEAFILVEDRGHGFSEEALDAVFRPFFSTKTRGSGLGLATSRRIIERHGGTIEVGNRQDGGASVRCRLPRRPNTARSDTDETAKESKP
ncbi:MAG: ATP-binding protein, partial [Candidatus Poribacteria bacterium]|nr:ATP-binding protein [Candidatus Poribacteria bacterium]